MENDDSEIIPEMRTVALDWLVLIPRKIFKFKENKEVEYVSMQETLQFTQNKFTKDIIMNMEYKILNQINFEILAPTMCEYSKVFAIMLDLKNTKVFQGFYILNIILFYFHMPKYPNCILALAIIS